MAARPQPLPIVAERPPQAVFDAAVAIARAAAAKHVAQLAALETTPAAPHSSPGARNN